jgi:LPS export ABC transporter protein LptC
MPLTRFRERIKIIKYIFLSTGICVIIVIIGSVFFNNSEFNSTEPESPVKNKKYKLEKDYTLSINRTIFEGLSNDSTPYKLLAENISKHKDNSYLLKAISGKYLYNEGDFLIRSENGILDDETKQLQLQGKVAINYNGIELKTDQLYFDINTKDSVSPTPVTIDFDNSHIRAQQMETKESTKIIELKGKVESVFSIQNSE